ncbi:hypothetical protein SNOG_01605 [Parastagonospora nodorum SN15]|uniref:Uncharacterized protein n=1 Tax=Phaeosphaeria nodorum (strain SN15 / ATCC MYA-4574 / FGSC 10173) TaxID=321614 RepID=Q0V309_PHANO|nr:hypothetical protein SNOG_01605 [Parastagonospora nodorum SN15]EAT91254.1 hypothetical protein SNOG_01605 [Parastagonospora nodorum SN15]
MKSSFPPEVIYLEVDGRGTLVFKDTPEGAVPVIRIARGLEPDACVAGAENASTNSTMAASFKHACIYKQLSISWDDGK